MTALPDVVEFEEALEPYLRRILYFRQGNHGAVAVNLGPLDNMEIKGDRV
jgi:hypothetical protein